ncbi:MAG: phospholipase D-like domain-containing protein [Myxococcota bacterium]
MAERTQQDRIGRALRDLLRQRAPDGDAGEVEERASELTGMLEALVGRLRRNLLDLWLPPTEQDLVVGAGETFELGVRLWVIEAQLAERVRFRVGERTLGEVAVTGPEVWAALRIEEPGPHEVTAEPLGRGGRRLLGLVRGGGRHMVQVVSPGPVVAVEADTVLEAEPPAALQRLREAGVQVIWADFADEPRIEEVRAAVRDRGLPEGAVLAFPRNQEGFPTLGRDFRPALVRDAARRLRSAGVALVGVVAGDVRRFREGDQEGVLPLAVGEVDDRSIADLHARAQALHDRRRESDRFAFRLEERTRAVAREGNLCRVELDNRVAREALLRSLEAAERSIDLQVYIFEDGRFADLLGAHLIRAARRGVRVRVIVDALYSGEQALGRSNPILRTLRDEPGIEVRAHGPLDSATALELRAYKERDHRKVVVVDGRCAFVTGRNVGDVYYTGFDEVAVTDFTPYERIPWMDAHVEVEGPVARDVERAFADAWRQSGGEDEGLDPSPIEGAPGGSRARIVLHHGPADTNAMAAYEALLDAASRHVFIVNGFPIASVLAAAVRRALARGVAVTILTGNGLPRRGDGTFFRGPVYRELFEYLTKQRLEPLLRAGVRAFEVTTDPGLPLVVCAGGVVRPYVHAKLMTADGRAMSLGSANLDVTASYWEREANVVVEDPRVVGEVEATLTGLADRGQPLDPDGEYWARDRVLRTVVGGLWPDAVYS